MKGVSLVGSYESVFQPVSWGPSYCLQLSGNYLEMISSVSSLYLNTVPDLDMADKSRSERVHRTFVAIYGTSSMNQINDNSLVLARFSCASTHFRTSSDDILAEQVTKYCMAIRTDKLSRRCTLSALYHHFRY